MKSVYMTALKPSKEYRFLLHGIWWTLEQYLDQIKYTMKCLGK